MRSTRQGPGSQSASIRRRFERKEEVADQRRQATRERQADARRQALVSAWLRSLAHGGPFQSPR